MKKSCLSLSVNINLLTVVIFIFLNFSSLQSCRSRKNSELSSYGFQGVCGGRPVPSNKTRKMRNHRLTCASNSDHYIRLPQPWPAKDKEEWEMYEVQGNREKMQEVGLRKPKIRWQGSIPYQTIERWDWTEWYYGPDPSCGYDHNCTTDSDGKEHCTDTMRSCYHDEDRSEAYSCSTETMRYKAQFLKPDNSWHPPRQGEIVATKDEYFDILPNKYDLLPGEQEIVHIYNTGMWEGTDLTPYASVANAWNDYAPAVNFEGGGATAACRFHETYTINLNVTTNRRIVKQTPNTFTISKNELGEEIDPLKWYVKQVDGMDVPTIPNELRLTDVGSEMIATLSRHTRTFTGEIEQAKLETGWGEYDQIKEQREQIKQESKKENGFWQRAIVRVFLYKKMFAARDIQENTPLYLESADVAMFEDYKIPLDSTNPDKKLLRPAGPGPDWVYQAMFGNLQLTPIHPYYLHVSIYNKGVPFYLQDCADPKAKKAFACRLGLRWENAYFSKPLPVNFSTKGHDERDFFTKYVIDPQQKSLIDKIATPFRWMFGF